jgi:VanZ family protein
LPRLTKRAFVRYWIPVILWLIVIVIESTLLSAARTGSFVDPILHAIMPWFSMETIERIHEVGRKVGHFLGYGLMSYLFFRALRGTHHVHVGTEDFLRTRIVPAGQKLFDQLWQWTWVLWAMFGTFLVAVADEMHQMSDPTRTGTWRDILLDCFGAAIFQLFILVLIRLRARTIRPLPASLADTN